MTQSARPLRRRGDHRRCSRRGFGTALADPSARCCVPVIGYYGCLRAVLSRRHRTGRVGSATAVVFNVRQTCDVSYNSDTRLCVIAVGAGLYVRGVQRGDRRGQLTSWCGQRLANLSGRWGAVGCFVVGRVLKPASRLSDDHFLTQSSTVEHKVRDRERRG